MRVINNTSSGIYVNDIGIVIPIGKFGVVSETIERLAKSMEFLDLLRGGKVSVEDDGDLSLYEKVEIGGETKYIVGGMCLWGGVGKTKPFVNADVAGFSNPIKSLDRIRESSTSSKRYVLQKDCLCSVSFGSINVVLNRQNPACTLSEESFNLAEVQQAIGSKLVHVREILESKIESSGKIVWVPKIKKDGSNVEESKISLELDRSSPYVGEGLECFWEGPTFDAGGYANMNRQYIMNLTRLGVSVRPSVMATGDQIEKPLRDAISGLFSASVSPNSPKVFSTNIPSRHSGLSISYTMMETERKVHKDLVTHMGVADELWVPSDWNKEMFVNGGVNKKITVMPLGIDSEMYKPRSPKIIFKCGVKSFVFLGVSTWLWRKGYDVLLKAYSRAFTSDDDVSLVVFTRVPLLKGAHYDRIYSDIVQMVGGTKSTFPHLVVVPSILPSKAMPYLYNSVDAFALFSRGEGWGLPYCEATASGIPVIGADHGGQKMFLNNDNSFLVKPDKVSPCHSSLLPISPFYHGMHFADYSESAIDEAAEKMRYVFEHQEEAKEKAAICRANLLENFTWQKSACRVADRLKELK